jgi:hypothetical protein
VRNIIAHRGYSKMQHEVQYFADEIREGWRREMDGSLTINPELYSVQVEDAFLRERLYLSFCQQQPRDLLLRKYHFFRQWLDLGKSDAIARAIKKLDRLDPATDLGLADVTIRKQLASNSGGARETVQG